MDNVILLINLSPLNGTIGFSNILYIHWIVIYPVDSTIHLLNDPGLQAVGGGGGPGRGTPHMKGVGMLVGNFELNP